MTKRLFSDLFLISKEGGDKNAIPRPNHHFRRFGIEQHPTHKLCKPDLGTRAETGEESDLYTL